MIDAFTIRQVYASPLMHDKPSTAPAHEFHLSDHTVLILCGRDSVSFAQSQFMNDVTLLGDGQWQWNGWLNAKGRVIALFALLRVDANTLWLVLPDMAASALAERLQRYVFRSKVRLTVADIAVTGQFDAPQDAQGNTLAHSGEIIELDLSAEGGPRCWRLGPALAAADSSALTRWAAFDLQHGLPRLPASHTEQWTPQQLSLERLSAFSIKKGCYPGQEIVARTHFLGQAKRATSLLQTPLPLALDTIVSDGQQELGRVLACADTWALAVLPLQNTPTTLQCAEQRVQALPFYSGLAR